MPRGSEQHVNVTLQRIKYKQHAGGKSLTVNGRHFDLHYTNSEVNTPNPEGKSVRAHACVQFCTGLRPQVEWIVCSNRIQIHLKRGSHTGNIIYAPTPEHQTVTALDGNVCARDSFTSWQALLAKTHLSL